MNDRQQRSWIVELAELIVNKEWPWPFLDARAAVASSTVNLGLPETLAAIRMGR